MAIHRWFGESWDAPANTPDLRVDPPVDKRCMDCNQPIEATDRGVIVPHAHRVEGEWQSSMEPHHLWCFVAGVSPHSEVPATLPE